MKFPHFFIERPIFAAVLSILSARTQPAADPWDDRTAWRMNLPSREIFVLKDGDTERRVTVTHAPSLTIEVDDEKTGEAMQRAALDGYADVSLFVPFVHRSKADIVVAGAKYGTPFAQTWSCYKGGAQQCGRCGTCVERREAFDIAGVEDPTVYADDSFWREAVARKAADGAAADREGR